ncbi:MULTISPECIES: hypothetical protein [unclassified Gemella]|uniref:hypothetical protein n=1 Tax=unclassified Gemella TaxID=2624949 RepID=UPI001C04FAE2|nr:MULTISPECIES: hypothetical protein [unclassified Gemella]MBU0279132.1 hypothetical protein [Gemella sp. zg-1178]QWQ38609.1 hypothetical protein KMP11_06590 [Gemella sp. zg-570]
MKSKNKLSKEKEEKTKEEKIRDKVKVSFSNGNKLSLEDIIENYLCAACIKI